MISIVMAYYNREAQLVATLKSIVRSKQKDIEVILVDDGSKNRVDHLKKKFPFLKIIRLEKEDKWYTNCCIPYNVGIAKAEGDIVIIQNPECFHLGDVLTYIVENLTEKNYLSISAYALNRGESFLLRKQIFKPEWKFQPMEYLQKYPQRRFGREVGWYNHPVYCHVYYHFCAAITKSNMDKLGGFDERYAEGIAYDDNELVERVSRLGLRKVIPTDVSVIHQHHLKTEHFSVENYSGKHTRNRKLFEIKTKNEDTIKVEINGR